MPVEQHVLENNLKHLNRIADKDAIRRLIPGLERPYQVAERLAEDGIALKENPKTLGIVDLVDQHAERLGRLGVATTPLEYTTVTHTGWSRELKQFYPRVLLARDIVASETSQLTRYPDEDVTKWRHDVYAKLGIQAGDALIDLIGREGWVAETADDGHLRIRDGRHILAAEVDLGSGSHHLLWEVYLKDGARVATTTRLVGSLDILHAKTRR